MSEEKEKNTKKPEGSEKETEKKKNVNSVNAEEKSEEKKEQTSEKEEKEEETKAEPSEEEKLKAENAELRDKYLRLMAEFDNYRKRSVKERQEIYPEATASAVEAFLPMADNFERAAGAECSDEKYKEGVMMIMTQLQNAFKKLGVEEINRPGEPFDPNLENAVSQISDENLEENTVAQVYQKGYRLGDKIIRHAMVVVAK